MANNKGQNESNRIRFVYMNKLHQRLSQIRQNYQNGIIELSEKSIRIISMACEFINKNQLHLLADKQ
ncbi:hypothetical protein BLA29_006819 [Euroglyphus maynei]|uniref:Uncharacterized protein n=1 Tax=Euroglyphus maynei TaxID=6958 RepID=A0A1Y3BTQ9_EURMA|nr:hypothetical protein BLA29_006819 [Euroglyphus maynei]